MVPTPFKSKTTPWRLQIPGRYFADKKRRTEYFKTQVAAAKRHKEILKNGAGAFKAVPADQFNRHAPLINYVIQELGTELGTAGGAGAPESLRDRLVEAIAHFKLTRMNVRLSTVREAFEEFCAVRKTTVSVGAWRNDKNRLLKLVRKFEQRQISEITETELRRFFDGLATGCKKSIKKSARVFFKWAKGYGLLGVNPMAEIANEANERWGVRKDIYDARTFGRMLRITAGIEAPRPGAEPTRKYIALLPWLTLSGFCGLRSCEAFATVDSPDAILWGDLYFDRGFIHIRPEVSKKTQHGAGRNRFIKAARHLEAAKAWLDLCPCTGGLDERIVPIREKSLSELKRKFEKETGLKFLPNALRHSFASYTLTVDGLVGVGALAIEMGNSEQVAKQFYIESLEPGAGYAWFNLRPDDLNKVIPIIAAAAAA
jgi:hypothetical protein